MAGTFIINSGDANNKLIEITTVHPNAKYYGVAKDMVFRNISKDFNWNKTAYLTSDFGSEAYRYFFTETQTSVRYISTRYNDGIYTTYFPDKILISNFINPVRNYTPNNFLIENCYMREVPTLRKTVTGFIGPKDDTGNYYANIKIDDITSFYVKYDATGTPSYKSGNYFYSVTESIEQEEILSSRGIVDFFPSYVTPICTIKPGREAYTAKHTTWIVDATTITSTFAKDFNNDFSRAFSNQLVSRKDDAITSSVYDVYFKNIYDRIESESGNWKKTRVNGCEYPYCLLYINKLGGWEMLPLVGKGISNYKKNINRQKKYSIIGNGTETYNQSYQNNNYSVLKSECGESVDFYLPFVPKSRTEYISDILYSPLCYLLSDGNGIKRCSVDTIDDVNRNQYTANFKLTLNIDNITNII